MRSSSPPVSLPSKNSESSVCPFFHSLNDMQIRLAASHSTKNHYVHHTHNTHIMPKSSSHASQVKSVIAPVFLKNSSATRGRCFLIAVLGQFAYLIRRKLFRAYTRFRFWPNAPHIKLGCLCLSLFLYLFVERLRKMIIFSG